MLLRARLQLILLLTLYTLQSGSSRALSQSDCDAVTVDGSSHTYANCIDLSQTLGLANPYVVSYSLSRGPTGSTVFKGAIVAKPLGWVGLGFPSSPTGGMLGSNAVLLAPNSHSPTGAVVHGVRLREYSATVVNRDLGNFHLNETAAERASDGTLRAVFTAELPDVYDTINVAPRRIVYAMGTLNGDALQSHITNNVTQYPFGRANIQFYNSQHGNSSDVSPQSSSINQNWWRAHAWLMTIGWGVLIPIGAVIAHAFKDSGGIWFQFHRTIQVLGLILGYIGLGMIFKYTSLVYPDNAWEIVYTKHRNIGISVIALGTYQALSLVLRPEHSSRYRRPWHIGHVLVGVSAIILAIYNVYYGLLTVKKTDKWTWVVYTVFIAVLMTVLVLRDVYRCLAIRKWRRLYLERDV